MFDNIPFEVQVEIIKRVPVKSLIRFLTVSKQWNYVIHSSEFITSHSVNQTKMHHLLVMNKVDSEYHFVSVVDDDSFPRHKFAPCVPPDIKLVPIGLMFDCSHGLVCLHGYTGDVNNKLVVFWNPSIRKSVCVLLPLRTWLVGYGVCPQTSDPKIVKITRASSSMDWHAEVFTLSSWAWRSIPVNLPLSISFYVFDQVVIDGVIHWRAYEMITDYVRIVTFDLTNEEFGEVHLPNSFKGSKYLTISKFKESLVVAKYLQHDFYAPIQDVWMINANLKSLFMELYSSIKESAGSDRFKIIGYRKNGEPITEHIGLDGFTTLLVFDPCSKQFNTFDSVLKRPLVFGSCSKFYSESLLLLNHHDSMI